MSAVWGEKPWMLDASVKCLMIFGCQFILEVQFIKKYLYMVHIYNGILLNHSQEQSNTICSNRESSQDDHTKWSKSDRER